MFVPRAVAARVVRLLSLQGKLVLRAPHEPHSPTAHALHVGRGCLKVLLEGDQALLLIELHAARPRPLVYRFTKVTAEEAKK